MRKLGTLGVAVVTLVLFALGGASALGPGNEQEDLEPGQELLDIVQNDDVIIEGNVCASDDNHCADGETFTIGPSTGFEFLAKDNVPRIGLVDIDTNQDDWVLQTSGGTERFEIRSYNEATFNTPLRIESRSGNDLVYLDDTYRVGIGTPVPDAQLEVFSAGGAAQIVVDENSAIAERRVQLALENQGPTAIGLSNTEAAIDWEVGLDDKNRFEISKTDSPTRFMVKKAGNIVARSSAGINILNLNSTGKLKIRNAAGDATLTLTKNGNLKISGALTEGSDRNAKHHVEAVDTSVVLAKVRDLQLAEWSYLSEDVRHVGPMAQDFYAAFGLGADDSGLSTLDTSGVALAAIQELAATNDELRATNQDLEARLLALEAGQSPATSHAQVPFAWMLAAVAIALLGAVLWRTSKRAAV